MAGVCKGSLRGHHALQTYYVPDELTAPEYKRVGITLTAGATTTAGCDKVQDRRESEIFVMKYTLAIC